MPDGIETAVALEHAPKCRLRAELRTLAPGGSALVADEAERGRLRNWAWRHAWVIKTKRAMEGGFKVWRLE